MEGFKDSVDYELLGRYLGGESTPAEAREVEEWLAASPENPNILNALKEIWEKAATEPVEDAVDVDAAWNRVQRHVRSQEETPRLESPWKRSRAKWFIRAAAAVFFLICVGLVLLLNQLTKTPPVQMLVWESGKDQLTDTLPDGTVVSLNAQSRLEFPAEFAEGERVVKLQGEGFFDVAHDTTHPFRIQAGVADVRVLGTSFNLSARDHRVEVAVLNGRVELSEASAYESKTAQKLLVTAGNAASFDRKTGAMQPEKGEVENHLFWKTQKLVFRDQPLETVVAELNALLGDSIVIGNDAIRRCALTTTFEKPSIASALNVIAETFNLEVTHNEKSYTIQGSGCE